MREEAERGIRSGDQEITQIWVQVVLGLVMQDYGFMVIMSILDIGMEWLCMVFFFFFP